MIERGCSWESRGFVVVVVFVITCDELQENVVWEDET